MLPTSFYTPHAVHLLVTLPVTVKLESVQLTQSTSALQSEVVFHCLPVLRDVIQPSSIEIDVKWFADGENILAQTFNAGVKASSSLPEGAWRLGQTVGRRGRVKRETEENKER